MNIFLEEHQEILKLLIKHQVDFMLIGGYAVIFHGYGRTTGDMDLWLKPTNENKRKLIDALQDAGYETEALTALNKLNFETQQVFSIGAEPQKIDFLTYINLVKYEDADRHKIIGDVDGMPLPVIHLNDLILSKINTGRKQDEADIEELQKVNKNIE